MNKFAVFGTGIVGQTIATSLTKKGNQVIMGSRTKDNPKAKEWQEKNSENSFIGDFSEAGEFGEIIFNCISGEHTIEALRMAGEDALADKIIVDIANPLDFSDGFPPTMKICNHDSLAETIQREFPRSLVVKTLNMVSASLMVEPSILKEGHDLFLCGNDLNSKKEVTKILKESFDWQRITDLGDIKKSRGMEMFLPFWLSLYQKLGTSRFNIKIVTEN